MCEIDESLPDLSFLEDVESLVEPVRSLADQMHTLVKTVGELAAAAKRAVVPVAAAADLIRGLFRALREVFQEVRAALQNPTPVRRDHREILAQLRLLQLLLLNLIRIVIAIAMHPSRCSTYLLELHERRLLCSDRSGPGDDCLLLLTRQPSTCQGVVAGLN